MALDFVGGEHLFPDYTRAFRVPPKATVYGPLQLSNTREQPNWIGALRITAVIQTLDAEEIPVYTPDPAGQIDAKAFIIHEHGRFGLFGTSRQEMEGIPAAEYVLPAATFFGTLHQPPNFYTNVGITNLHPTETVTFFVQYRDVEPIVVTVGPRSSQQIRISGGTRGFEGSAGRYAVVTPAWAVDGGTPTPWVAYASTVDLLTGDAFTGLRTPHDITKTILK